MSDSATTVPAVNRPTATDRTALPPAPSDVNVYDSPATAVFVVVKSLPPLVQPARAVRYAGTTLLYVDPEALCAEMAFWVRDNLTAQERIFLRTAFGMSRDLNTPPPDDLLDGCVQMPQIPDVLRLPGDRDDLRTVGPAH